MPQKIQNRRQTGPSADKDGEVQQHEGANVSSPTASLNSDETDNVEPVNLTFSKKYETSGKTINLSSKILKERLPKLTPG